jgi:hypothetical protein
MFRIRAIRCVVREVYWGRNCRNGIDVIDDFITLVGKN